MQPVPRDAVSSNGHQSAHAIRRDALLTRVSFDRNLPIETLESDRWGDPPEESTAMVRSVYELRRQPIGALSPWDLARLIGQGVGLPWTLPLALEILEETAPRLAEGGFYDDDLLSAVIRRDSATWSDFPEIAQQVEELLPKLTDLSSDLQRAAKRFLNSRGHS